MLNCLVDFYICGLDPLLHALPLEELLPQDSHAGIGGVQRDVGVPSAQETVSLVVDVALGSTSSWAVVDLPRPGAPVTQRSLP